MTYHPAIAARFARDARAEILDIITTMGVEGMSGADLAAHVAPYLHITSVLPVIDGLVRDRAVMLAGRRLIATTR